MGRCLGKYRCLPVFTRAPRSALCTPIVRQNVEITKMIEDSDDGIQLIIGNRHALGYLSGSSIGHRMDGIKQLPQADADHIHDPEGDGIANAALDPAVINIDPVTDALLGGPLAPGGPHDRFDIGTACARLDPGGVKSRFAAVKGSDSAALALEQGQNKADPCN